MILGVNEKGMVRAAALYKAGSRDETRTIKAWLRVPGRQVVRCSEAHGLRWWSGDKQGQRYEAEEVRG